MRPGRRNRRRIADARPPRGRRVVVRRGFTLVEMMISVTLVLMMMLMFAEIYSLAQQTISTQKGIAENDQKARILVEVLRRDLDTRTFRSIYPFKLEPAADFAVTDEQAELLGRRRGYFSISENDPADPTDDVLQLTIEVDQPGHGGAGDRLYGKAGAALPPPRDTNTMRSLPTQPAAPAGAGGVPPLVPLETEQNHPEYDDGVRGNNAASSDAAEISYFLRNGNLYRSVLLIRKPYIPEAPSRPPIDPAWAGGSPYANYAIFSTQYPPLPADYPAVSAPPNAVRSVWNDFDFSVYRFDADGAAPFVYEWWFHDGGGLSNDGDGVGFSTAGGGTLHVPRTLGAPYLRFGHEFDILGRPLETSGGTFFGRYTIAERSSPAFAYPGSGWAPFDGSTGPATYAASTARRGVDLMLSNVHSFDIQVWDDVVGDYVNLGHTLTGQNPYVVQSDGTHPVQNGFYHASRLRNPFPQAMLAAGEDYYYDEPAITGNFGNRYDTWSPRMFIENAVAPIHRWRTGRAPYRPQWTNPDPNAAEFNDPPAVPVDPTSVESVGRESRMAFADSTLDDNGNSLTILDLNGDGSADDPLDSDAEAPLRAVRIIVRYLDTHSGQMRQATIETSLID